MKILDLAQFAIATKEALDLERRPWKPEEHTILITQEEWESVLTDIDTRYLAERDWAHNPTVLGGVRIVPVIEIPQLRPAVCKHGVPTLL